MGDDTELPPRKPRKPRLRISENERVEITLARFNSLQTRGELESLDHLATRFERDKVVVSRIISSALRSNLIEIRVSRSEVPTSWRRPDIEAKLLRKFKKLRLALVLDLPERAQLPSSNEKYSYSDRVHHYLGSALATEIDRLGLIADASRIGIGPGRGVFETARAFVRYRGIDSIGVTLVSLSGVGYLKHQAKGRNVLLDPDFTVVTMSEAFQNSVSIQLVASSLVVESGGRRNQRILPWLCNSEGIGLEMALMGVGTFGPGHRFFVEASGVDPSAREPLYNPIRASFQSLLRLSDAISREGYSPVGDLGYHLFFVPPPAGVKIPQELAATIVRQIDVINDHLLSAHAPDLKSIRSTILVAGTEQKVGAIHYALTGGLVNATGLCTDARAAAKLISLAT